MLDSIADDNSTAGLDVTTPDDSTPADDDGERDDDKRDEETDDSEADDKDSEEMPDDADNTLGIDTSEEVTEGAGETEGRGGNGAGAIQQANDIK